jgi:hypothetical protein
MFNLKFTPEAFFMLPFAIMLDLSGIILLCFGLDDFGITDALGIGFINGWLLLRGKKTNNNAGSQGKKGAMSSFKKAFTGKTSKFIIPSFAELIPYLGSLPFWTISVFLNLTEDE